MPGMRKRVRARQAEHGYVDLNCVGPIPICTIGHMRHCKAWRSDKRPKSCTGGRAQQGVSWKVKRRLSDDYAVFQGCFEMIVNCWSCTVEIMGAQTGA